jgi:hypothetical protein
MRLLAIAIAVSAVTTFAGRADAVGRMPGHTLQFLGWGYGAGYHAPIVHAHPPVQRGILHAPGGHWLGRSVFGHSQLSPHASPCHPNCGALHHAPMHATPYPFEVIPDASSEFVPQTLPPAPYGDGRPRSDVPPVPSAESESLPVPEASLPRSIRRG